MSGNKSVISAVLGIAFLAMPITAAARNRDAKRAAAPALRPAPIKAVHVEPVPKFHFVPRTAPAKATAFRPAPIPRPTYARPAFVPLPAAAPVRNAEWFPQPANQGWIPPGHRGADYPGWIPPGHRQHFDRAYNNGVVCDEDGDDCRQLPYSNNRVVCDEDGDDCRQLPYSYGPTRHQEPDADDYYSDSYDSPQYYSPMTGEGSGQYLSRLMYARAQAQRRYDGALRHHDHLAAKHYLNAIRALDRQIASSRAGRYGYAGPSTAYPNYAYSGPGGYNAPYSNSYGYNPYGSGNMGGLSSFLAPFLNPVP